MAEAFSSPCIVSGAVDPKEQVVRALAARRRSDFDAVRLFLSDGVVWHEPGSADYQTSSGFGTTMSVVPSGSIRSSCRATTAPLGKKPITLSVSSPML